MIRIEPKTLKIDSPFYNSLFTPELDRLSELFEKNGFELRIAGGAVRDLLMGFKPDDVDFATTATPSQMKEMFKRDQIRMLNKRGEEHGTITCRINDRQNFEVTTLRIDKVCDGRRAEVEYTKDWQVDANRRDLTVNSLFLDLNGTIFDYFNGIKDLENKRIIFVGESKQRIQEDYLRILRYFRFFGRIANSEDDHDEKTLDVIAENAHGLANISGERLWMELRKIVSGRFSASIVEVMLKKCLLSPYLGLPENADTENFKKIVHICQGLDPKPMTLISALFRDEDDIYRMHKKMKLSNSELHCSSFIITHRKSAKNAPLKFFKDLILGDKPNYVNESRSHVYELLKYTDKASDFMLSLISWETPKFPVDGLILGRFGVQRGPSIGKMLVFLFDLWKKSDYSMTEEQLLAKIDEIDENRVKVPDSDKKRRKIDREKTDAVQ